MTCHAAIRRTQIAIVQPPESFHRLTFAVTVDERAAGYLARCEDCPALFKSAVEWVGSRCPVVP